MPPVPGYGLRVTMFFEDGNSGWSETHYDRVQSTLVAALSEAQEFLLPARQACLANGPWLKYIRVSYDGVFRDSQVAYTAEPPRSKLSPYSYINNPNFNNVEASRDWNTVLLRGVGAGSNLYRKQIYMSGIPTPDPSDLGHPSNDALLFNTLNAYGNVLTQAYGFPVWIKDNPPYVPVPVTQITQVTPPPNATYQFTTAGPHNLPTNLAYPTRVFLHGMQFIVNPGLVKRLYPNPNGGYPYSVVDANHFIAIGWQWPGPNNMTGYMYVPNSGSAQPNVKGIVPYGSIIVEDYTHRKRGRPFDSPRGRSRTRQTLSAY